MSRAGQRAKEGLVQTALLLALLVILILTIRGR